jgi:carboxymethylenebutenolidase
MNYEKPRAFDMYSMSYEYISSFHQLIQIGYHQIMSKMITAGNIPIYRVEPTGKFKGAILLIHEVWGLTDHIKDVAERFAKEGYLVYAPDLLSDTDIASATKELQADLFNPEKRNEAQPKLREIMAPIHSPEFARITIDKLRVCFDFLYKDEQAHESVAVIGYCFGGTYSFHLAVQEPKLRAAVAYYGHADMTEEQLENIACPVLAFYGQDDERLMESLPELQKNMETAGVEFTGTIYEGAGHAFFNDTNPYAYNENAATDSWRLTLDFLSRNLT